MWVFRSLFIVAFLTGATLASIGQELNCRVSVQVTTVQGIDRTIFQRMEQDIANYLNNRKWTDDVFDPAERIECSLTILIGTADLANNRYQGTAQVQATRPVYNGTYETVTLNFQDKHFNINYAPFTQLNFSDAIYNGNLPTLLNFYAYMILGFDYDSFSPSGGLPFFQKARNMVQLASNSGETGWNTNDGTSTRFWLAENLLNNSYRRIHQVIYSYHREGLDQMVDDAEKGRKAILSALDMLEKLFQQNPNVYITRVFLDAKIYEIANLMKGASQGEQEEFLDIMRVIDPSNLGIYRQALRSSNG